MAQEKPENFEMDFDLADKESWITKRTIIYFNAFGGKEKYFYICINVYKSCHPQSSSVTKDGCEVI